MEVKVVNYPISITPIEANPMIKNVTKVFNWEIKIWKKEDLYSGSVFCGEKNYSKEFHRLSDDEVSAIKELKAHCNEVCGVRITTI